MLHVFFKQTTIIWFWFRHNPISLSPLTAHKILKGHNCLLFSYISVLGLFLPNFFYGPFSLFPHFFIHVLANSKLNLSLKFQAFSIGQLELLRGFFSLTWGIFSLTWGISFMILNLIAPSCFWSILLPFTIFFLVLRSVFELKNFVFLEKTLSLGVLFTLISPFMLYFAQKLIFKLITSLCMHINA